MSGTGFSFGAKKIGIAAKPAPKSQPKANAFGADSDDEDDDALKEQKIGSFGGKKLSANKPATKISLGKPVSKPLASRGAPPKRKQNLFADEEEKEKAKFERDGVEEVEIREFGGIEIPSATEESTLNRKQSSSKGPPTKPPAAPPKAKAAQVNVYGDLSSAFTSKKYGETAEELDPSIYDYDAVYDSMKPQKHEYESNPEKKKDYMKALRDAAALRKRDQVIAEERKLAKEREAEGDEFADKEKFVTSAYKKQQEEARRLEKEEKEREEREAKENKKTGFTGFYKQMLERKENEHQELVNAAERAAKEGPKPAEEKDDEKELDDVEKAKKINEALGDEKIIINDDGQLVDKRQLLKGGLNVTAAPKKSAPPAATKPAPAPYRPAGNDFMVPGGSKQAMRERQTKMMEAQLEQATKRAREEEEEERKKIELESKSKKTKVEIMSAKERYLQRKREAEEAKKEAAEGA